MVPWDPWRFGIFGIRLTRIYPAAPPILSLTQIAPNQNQILSLLKKNAPVELQPSLLLEKGGLLKYRFGKGTRKITSGQTDAVKQKEQLTLKANNAECQLLKREAETLSQICPDG